MKKSSRKKSSSSTSCSTIVPVPVNVNPSCSTYDLELLSLYSHEQVHIYDKLCSTISSNCEIAYSTSEGITISVPESYQRESSSYEYVSSSSLSSMIVTRIIYPYETNEQNNSISINSTSFFIFEKLKNKYLFNLYKSYINNPKSLSSFDRLLSNDTTKYKGFRRCLFSPYDIRLNQGQSILATITSAHEVFIYEIISSSKRFFHSKSSDFKIDLTKYLFENIQLEDYLIDSNNSNDYRLLYFHLTSAILWNKNGTFFFQLQYSGHIIIWNFHGFSILNQKPLYIIDTKISKPLTMTWNESSQILFISGKENQRLFIKLDKMKLFYININHNDYINVEHSILIQSNQNTLILIESKINYCFIYTIDIHDDQCSSYDCNEIGNRILPSSIVGFEEEKSSILENNLSILIGCEDGTMHSLIISVKFPIRIIDIKLVANGQIKSCCRKPLILRHFNLSSNEYILERIYYSPIVAPNVKFGFVICTLHRWLSNKIISLDKIIEHFLERINIPLWSSSDELVILLNELKRNKTNDKQIKKNSNSNSNSNNNYIYLQRLCRLYSLLNNRKELNIYENQLLESYRNRLSIILNKIFSNIIDKLSQIELFIYKICSKDDQTLSSNLFLCPICNNPLIITKDDLLNCQCSNKHVWPRCSTTLLPLYFDSAQTCSLCDRTITLIQTNDQNYNNFIQYKDKQLDFFFSSICTFCM
ncbi:unnamed protein product [Rotaria sordida]|uniref:Transcription factor IIIC putative zinc-finger domain-containing protein n=1 Tax=Rotaria sordida TaxID=392033 RepID=A0A818U9P6_9BILA|nr:unnamed protein product [Rotaria sordida]